MKIAGLQKMTLLDFPGRVACTVFLQGCNFRCPFCHNSQLLGGNGPEGLTEEALLDFLQKRQGLLDGVCITGGEPTLQKDLPRLLQRIKALGYAVKLDTNGSQPGMLKELVAQGLVDYVAMDVKNSPARYGETVGVPQLDVSPMEESLRFLTAGGADYELRTTVVQELHDDQSIQAMGEWLFTLAQNRPVKALYIQPYKDADMVLQKGLHTPSEAVLQGFCALLRPFAQTVAVRG